MSFLAPGWLGTALLGLAAAAVPIIIHLLFRTRFRVVPWAAMQFLRKSLEETTRRIKFQELLLLLLRIALLILLAFALMRPSSRRSTGQGGAPVDAVFILDASGSMAFTDGGRTRLDAAKGAALRLLDSLPPQSTVRILRAAAHAADLGPASPTNRDQARFILQQLEPTHESTQWLPALQKAGEVLTRGSLANKEVYLFSDMQRSAWEKDGPAVQSTLSELQQLGEVILVHAGDGHVPANATLTNLRPQVALPAPGERVPFVAEVRNTGSADLQGMTVTFRGSDSERDVDTQPVPPLKPGEMAPVTLTARLDRRGKNLVTAELQGDQLAVDNRLDYLIETRDNLKILIIDGRSNEADPAKMASYFLAHALRSARAQRRDNEPGQVQLDVVPPGSAYPALLADVHVCFLVGLGAGDKLAPEFVQRLDTFVRSGGGLIAFPDPAAAAIGLEGLADLPARWGTPFTKPPEQPLIYDIKSIPSQSFLGAFRFAPLDRLGQTETTAGHSFDQVRPDTQVLVRFSDGSPALVGGQRGQGTVILSASSADLRGSDAPLRPSYVPLVQAIVGHVLNQQSGRKNLVAGETYSWSPPLDLARHRFELIPPAPAQPKALGLPQIVNGHPTVTTGETSQAGFYRLVPETAGAEETGDAGVGGDVFAVVPDPAETADLTTLTRDQLNTRFTREPVHLAAAQLSTEGLYRSRVQREWTETLFWVLLALCFGELAFSWFCNREV